MTYPLGRDSVTAADIPLDNLAVVMGYADGLYQWSAADWARFPDPIVKLSISVHAINAADVLDVEVGDASPSDVPGWCDRFNRPNRRAPTVYCNMANWDACKAAAGARRVDWWIALYPGTTDPNAIPPLPGAVAQQFHDFGGYDETVIFDPSWIGAPPEDDMATIGQKRATVLNCRVSSFGVWPEGLPEVDTYAGMIADDYSNVLDVLDRMIQDYLKAGGKPFWRDNLPAGG